jgi:hypothetical protein
MASKNSRGEGPFLPDRELPPLEVPDGVDPRVSMMRSALIEYKETSEGDLAVALVLC